MENTVLKDALTRNEQGEVLEKPEIGTDLADHESIQTQIKEMPAGNAFLVDTFTAGVDEYDKPVEMVENTVEKYNEIAFMLGMKCVKGVFNDAIYARVTADENGNRSIEFYQKYLDDSFSPKMTVKQSELLRSVIAESSRNGTKDKEEARRAKKFFAKVSEEYLGKLCVGMAEVLDIRKVLKVLATLMPSVRIPQNSIAELKSVELFQKILDETRMLGSPEFEAHKYFYAFSEDAFSYVAERLGYTRIILLEQLEEKNLLYLVESSSQYKTNVRVHGGDGVTYTAWRYCIRKISWQKDGDEDINVANF